MQTIRNLPRRQGVELIPDTHSKIRDSGKILPRNLNEASQGPFKFYIVEIESVPDCPGYFPP